MTLSPMEEDVKSGRLGKHSGAAIMPRVVGYRMYISLSRTMDASAATAPQATYFPVRLQPRACLHCSTGFKICKELLPAVHRSYLLSPHKAHEEGREESIVPISQVTD